MDALFFRQMSVPMGSDSPLLSFKGGLLPILAIKNTTGRIKHPSGPEFESEPNFAGVRNANQNTI